MRGGKREGAGRKRTAPDGEVRALRGLRASTAEWALIRKFAEFVKKDPEKAGIMLASCQGA